MLAFSFHALILIADLVFPITQFVIHATLATMYWEELAQPSVGTISLRAQSSAMMVTIWTAMGATLTALSEITTTALRLLLMSTPSIWLVQPNAPTVITETPPSTVASSATSLVSHATTHRLLVCLATLQKIDISTALLVCRCLASTKTTHQ